IYAAGDAGHAGILFDVRNVRLDGGWWSDGDCATRRHCQGFGVADTPVSILGLTLPALTFALSMDRILNGLTRPFFGWASVQIGRENTMFIAFVLEGAAILFLSDIARTRSCSFS